MGNWKGGGWKGGGGAKLPAWYPSDQPQTVVLEDPPSYGQPPKQGERGPFWGCKVNIGGTSYRWWLNPDEMNALENAGRPGKGTQITVTRTGQDSYSVVTNGGEQAPAYQRPSAPMPTTHEGDGYAPGRAVKAHVWFLKQLVLTCSEQGLTVPMEQLTTMATGQFIEWNKMGRPALTAKAPAAPPPPPPPPKDEFEDDEPAPF